MKILFKIPIFLIGTLSLAQNQNFATDTSDKSLWQDFTYDLGNIFKGVGYAYARPIHWGKDDFTKLGGTVTSTLSLYLFDNYIHRGFNVHEEKVPKLLLEYGFYAGQPENTYVFTGAIYLTGLFTHNEKLRRTGVLLISAASATGFLQQFTKSAVGRASP